MLVLLVVKISSVNFISKVSEPKNLSFGVYNKLPVSSDTVPESRAFVVFNEISSPSGSEIEASI